MCIWDRGKKQKTLSSQNLMGIIFSMQKGLLCDGLELVNEAAGALFLGSRTPQDGWESLCGEKGLALATLASPALAQAVAPEFKCKGSGEREVKRENASKQASSRLRYCSQSLVMDRTFFLFLICSTQEVFIVVSWNSKHGSRIDFFAEVCGAQIPENPLGFEVACSFSLNAVKNGSYLQQRWEIKSS